MFKVKGAGNDGPDNAYTYITNTSIGKEKPTVLLVASSINKNNAIAM